MSSVDSRPLRDEQDGLEAVRGVEADRLHALAQVRRDHEPAQQHRRRIVGMRLDRRSRSGAARASSSRDPASAFPATHAADGGRGRRSQAA